MISVDKPMPKDCTECPMMYDYIYCNAAEEGFCEKNFDICEEDHRPDWCPLIESIDEQQTVEAPTVSGWISVKDRLPDKAGKYLIARKGTDSYIDIAWFLKILRDNPQLEYEDAPDIPGFYKSDSEFDWIVSDVTHWMPLPEPPKKEEE